MRWSFAGMQVILHARACAASQKYAAVFAFSARIQDVLGAMSPPPAPMFMPHGASLDASSDELQSPPAAQGPLDDTATPVSARRYASLFRVLRLRVS